MTSRTLHVEGRQISERDFASFVEAALEQFGWTWTHFRPAYTGKGYRTPLSGHKGFVDYVAARGRKALFIELKSDKGKMSPEQWLWAEALPNYYLWRPADWNEVLRVLT